MGKSPKKGSVCEHCIKYDRRVSLLWSMLQMQAAFLPSGHDGARMRLRTKLHSAAETGLKIVTLGGSMTYGADSSCSWSGVLEPLLKRGLRAATEWVEVVKLAKRGTSSHGILMEIDTVEQHHPDIVLVDYTVNDGFMPNYVGTTDSWFNYTSTLIRMLLRMKSAPAVVYVETFTGKFTCEEPFESPHRQALLALDVPMINYRGAVCLEEANKLPINRTNYQNGWAAGGPHLAHPPCSVHERVAELVYHFLSGQVDELRCCKSVTGRDHPPIAFQEPFAEARCLHAPLTRLFSSYLWEDQYDVTPERLLEYGRRFPAVSHLGWKLYADVAGKPGWVANASQTGEIQFRVKTARGSAGAVLLEHLTTYEGIGTVDCDIDAGTPYTLNGWVISRASLGKIVIIRTASGEREDHILRCRSNMQKFKILNVRSC